MRSHKVVRVDQSPLNANRWNLQLDCKHDVWVTAKKRPKRKTAPCPHGCPAQEGPVTPEELERVTQGLEEISGIRRSGKR